MGADEPAGLAVARCLPRCPGKARALGAAGEDWLRSLPQLIRTLEDAWGVRVVSAFEGGPEANIAAATAANGEAIWQWGVVERIATGLLLHTGQQRSASRTP